MTELRNIRNLFGVDHNEEGETDLTRYMESRSLAYDVVMMPAPHPYRRSNNVDGRFFLCRPDTQEPICRNTVSKGYSIITPDHIRQELTTFVEEGWASPAAAFTMHGGQQEVVALSINPGQLPSPIAEGEEVKWYLVARNAHGKGAAHACVYGEREICTNGMTALASVSTFRIVHRGQAPMNYAKALQRVAQIRKVIETMQDRMNDFLRLPLSHSQATMLANVLVKAEKLETVRTRGYKPNGTDIYAKGNDGKHLFSAQARNLHAAFMDGFNMPRMGTNGRTGLDFYNGVTWVSTHWTPKRSKLDGQTLAEQLLSGARGKREALAIEMLGDLVLASGK